MILTVKVLAANYMSDYKILIQFSDATQQVVDFENFLKKNQHPQHDKYKELKEFKKFRIERGNVVWGKDWDLIFPVEQLHAGQLQF
ncbi:DUF2442 domain-containing protein [Dyadobacter pollutisoli]|uniref:DUF2442 domain-containing protein n=1 Tax=Dyadobacter pollutisoli TaxID=2910158 RepID=A0A9E8NBX8_9BACT|nr:DUF2442 domain-containing protein [Dyadobacter pollutisoli]WAC12202.1 DUF2442 domain-containing protein [Dyadobacter pollutisoli]